MLLCFFFFFFFSLPGEKLLPKFRNKVVASLLFRTNCFRECILGGINNMVRTAHPLTLEFFVILLLTGLGNEERLIESQNWTYLRRVFG